MTEERERLTLHLNALEAFMESPAYEGFLKALEIDQSGLEQEILENPIEGFDGLIAIAELRGARRVVMEQKQIFEGARAALKTRIDEMIDLERESTTSKL